MQINYKEVDKGMRELVYQLNKAGIVTWFSCEGHAPSFQSILHIDTDNMVISMDRGRMYLKWTRWDKVYEHDKKKYKKKKKLN